MCTIGFALVACDDADGDCLGEECLTASAQADASAGDDPLALARLDDLVSVPAIYQACSTHADCVFVSRSCSDCCDDVAISRSLESDYESRFADTCSSYEGGMCDCDSPDDVPRCEDRTCTAVPRSEVTDCFSPTQNLGGAGQSGSIGCGCEKLDAGVCVGGTSLRCTSVGRATGVDTMAWRVRDDDACASTRHADCRDGTITASVVDCLNEFLDCYELTDGSYCGKAH